MSELPSEFRAGLDNLADAIRTLAGAICHGAAGEHSDSEYRQREMAGVFYADAEQRFGDILRKLEPKKRDEPHRYINAMCKGKAK